MDLETAIRILDSILDEDEIGIDLEEVEELREELRRNDSDLLEDLCSKLDMSAGPICDAIDAVFLEG